MRPLDYSIAGIIAGGCFGYFIGSSLGCLIGAAAGMVYWKQIVEMVNEATDVKEGGD